MASLVIACLSQKGGVGKSTISQLVARTYANAGWQVKIADFNVKQKTSVDWVTIRMNSGWKPHIAGEPFDKISTALKADCDLLVIDGRPDTDTTVREIAPAATAIIIPTGVSAADLKPQLMFGNELLARGIPRERLLFVINRSNDSQIALKEAQSYIQISGFRFANTDLPDKVGYQNAMNIGRAVSETFHSSLTERAEALASEIVAFITEITSNERQTSSSATTA